MLSESAEGSIRLINQTLSLHRGNFLSITQSRNNTKRIGSRFDNDELQILRQATLVRFLSVSESFASEALLHKMEQMMSSVDHPSGRKVWEDHYEQSTSSWERMRSTFNDLFEVPKSLWTDILDLTHARNAVAHGHGNLTWRQRRRNTRDLEVKLNRRSIEISDGRIVLSENSIDQAAQVCRDFISSLDAAADLQRVVI
nr:DUF6545 domain-containing protein [Tsukamurella sp. TY48]